MWNNLIRTEIGGRIALGFLLIFFLVTGITRAGQKSDFLDYLHASKRWTNADNLYKFDVAYKLREQVKTWEELFLPQNAALLDALQKQTATYIYPPLFSFLLLPLTALSEKTASIIHTILNFSALLGILYLFSKPEKFQLKIKNMEWLLVLALLANFRYIENHIQNNQVSFLLVFITLLALTIKNDLTAGMLLALATSIKVTPAIFIIIFLYEKRFASILWFFVGIALWNLSPILYNFDYTIAMTKEWVTEVLGNALFNPLLRSWKNNQSLPATLSKYFVSGADFVNQPIYGMPFVSIPLEIVKILQLVIMFLFGAPLLILLKKKNRKWELTALLFLASALFSGITWIHSFVICLFPIYLVIVNFLNMEYVKKEKIAVLMILALALLTHRSIVGKIMENVFLMFSFLFYVNAALYVFILRFSLRKDEIRN